MKGNPDEQSGKRVGGGLGTTNIFHGDDHPRDQIVSVLSCVSFWFVVHYPVPRIHTYYLDKHSRGVSAVPVFGLAP